MSKSYCLKCKKEVSENTEKCKCGGTSFIYGEKFHIEDNNIVCDCGNSEFKSNMHMDFGNKAVTNYICTKCGNPIGKEYYRNEDDMFRFV